MLVIVEGNPSFIWTTKEMVEQLDLAIATVEPFMKGFTNMMRASQRAKNMFSFGSRTIAQQSVLIIAAGKHSYARTTNERVEQLNNTTIVRYFVVVNIKGPTSDTFKRMNQWASKPWMITSLASPFSRLKKMQIRLVVI